MPTANNQSNSSPNGSAMNIEGIDPGDVANGFYPHLRKVGPNDPEFLDIVSWLKSKGAPANTVLEADRALTPDGNGRWMPASIIFEANGARMKLDAALVFNFPHVALVELKQAFGFGNPMQPEHYPGPRQPVSYVPLSPIGAAWPEQGEDCYRPADTDRSDYGTEYADATGRYIKERRRWVFVSFGVWVKQRN